MVSRKSGLKIGELKQFLDEKVDHYNRPSFIEADPISIPHSYSRLQDIEISALLSSTIAWGNRKAILRSSEEMLRRMDGEPYSFVLHHTSSDLKCFNGFVHRTFNQNDLVFFVKALQRIYKKHPSLEDVFWAPDKSPSAFDAIVRFRHQLLLTKHELRSRKHVADPEAGSASKRMNMFLRWMVRDDQRGVDFGLWKKMRSSDLSVPLDVHSGNIARLLGLLERKQNDRKAVEELDSVLRSFDPLDPVKYDFALFGLGAIEKMS